MAMKEYITKEDIRKVAQLEYPIDFHRDKMYMPIYDDSEKQIGHIDIFISGEDNIEFSIGVIMYYFDEDDRRDEEYDDVDYLGFFSLSDESEYSICAEKINRSINEYME